MEVVGVRVALSRGSSQGGNQAIHGRLSRNRAEAHGGSNPSGTAITAPQTVLKPSISGKARPRPQPQHSPPHRTRQPLMDVSAPPISDSIPTASRTTQEEGRALRITTTTKRLTVSQQLRGHFTLDRLSCWPHDLNEEEILSRLFGT